MAPDVLHAVIRVGIGSLRVSALEIKILRDIIGNAVPSVAVPVPADDLIGEVAVAVVVVVEVVLGAQLVGAATVVALVVLGAVHRVGERHGGVGSLRLARARLSDLINGLRINKYIRFLIWTV